ACYAGGSPLAPEQDRGYRPVLERNRTVTDRGAPFAMRLAIALKARGYDNIVVGGYPGTVHNVDLGGKTITTHGQGSAFTIKATGLWKCISVNGKRVNNTRNEEKAILTDEDKDRIIMERNNLYGHY